MSEMAEHVICEKFEANIFAKSRCQNCFRTVTAHQCGNQELKEQAVETPDFAADTKVSNPCDPWDPLCILVPQCELYVCVGSEDREESWQESLEYTQLSCRAEEEEESEEASACPEASTVPGTDTSTNDTLSKDWEMTRLLDSILGSDKGDTMYYAGQKQEVKPESLHSNRPRWTEATSSSGRTEAWSSMKTECRAMSQDYGDSRRKHQTESSYFSLERQKSDPTRASSPPRVGRSTLPVHGDAKAAGKWPASSVSSADSDMSWRTSGSSEGKHGLMRQEYTVLADLPKPKRLNHRQAFEKDRSSSRTRSPGRAEVERIFGLERRKSETLEAFQALEEGLLERLDSKTLKLAKEGRLVRRKSSPTLRREMNKKLPWEPGQPSKSGGESLRLGRSGQRPERTSRSQGESRRSGSPAQQPERESRSKGTGTMHSAALLSQQAEKERKKREEPSYNPRTSGERAPLCSRKPTDSGRKSHLESGHLKISGKSTETKWKSCLDALHVPKPAKTVDKSQVNHRRPLERHKESDHKARGKPLLPVDTAGRLREDSRDRHEMTRAFSPGRGMAVAEKSGRAPSPPRHREVSWGAQGETRSTINPGRDMGVSLKSHGDAQSVCSPGRYSGGSQETRRSLSPGRCRESNWKSPGEARRSPSPGRPMEGICACSSQTKCCALSEQYIENSWKSQREVTAARNQSDWPGKEETLNPFSPSRRENSEWKGCNKSFCPATLPVSEQKWSGQEQLPCSVRPENSSRSQEGSLCHVHPMQLLEREWTNQGERLHSVKPGQQPSESNWGAHRFSTGWVEDDDQKDGRNCPRPMRPDSQMGNSWNDEEKLFHQHQLDGGQPPKSTCSSRNQDLYLDTSKKHKPDLLNFKKGWMSILDEPGEWTKHWFVLTDSSLRYYRDSNAEEADDLDGEIDLRSCTDVTEYAVQRNYGFQIHTKDSVFTLSAMTSGIRRNWIEALRKSIRPASVPDVTNLGYTPPDRPVHQRLSDCNKENSFRSYGSPKSSLRSEEHRPSTGPEVISRSGSRKVDGQHHAFDYVELSPLQQGSPLSQGSPQRTRGSARATDAGAKREELERDLALRSEERRKWFESPASGVLQADGPVGDPCQKAGGQESPGPPLSEAQKNRLSEEIEKKWQELERLPLKDSKRVPLMALLNQGKGSQREKNEALEKEVQALRSQLESFRAHSVAKSQREGQVPRGYISQEACERSLAEMETSHQQVMAEMQRHHQREMERLQLEKERLLSEEAAATAAAIEALKKAHREELNKELGRTRSFQKAGSDADILQRQHQSDVESLKRELQVLSEQYSQKCLEIGDLVHKAEEQEQMLQHCQQEGKELLRQNQELQRRLSEEIGQLRAFITAQASRDGTSNNSERNSCELEVLLRVKENELQYLKQEVQCLRDEIQMMQKDKKFASGKYQDVYAELNHIKRRSEREIEQLKEHLRLAMAALQEKEMMHNSIG